MWRGKAPGMGAGEGPQGPAPKDYVFGTRAIMEAIRADKELDKILVQKGLENELLTELLAEAKANKIPVVRVPPEKLNKVTRKNHQGVVAYISVVSYASLDHIISECYQRGKTPLLLLLDRITDVRNMGAIARTAECAGVDALVVPVRGSAQLNTDAVKTSAGALHHLPVCRIGSFATTLTYLKNNGIHIVACTEKGDTLIYEADFTLPVALVMGSEEDGISDEILEEADEVVKLPMYGKIGSLNVSVSAGLAIYEAVRQRNFEVQ